MIKWRIKGQGFANCNCDYGCPCQFNALPTYGNCEAAAGYKINDGFFGDVNLDGLKAAGIYSCPALYTKETGRCSLSLMKMLMNNSEML